MLDKTETLLKMPLKTYITIH